MAGGFRATIGGMDGAALHVIFDIAAWLAAGIAGLWLSRIRGLTFPSQSFELPYLAVLVFSAGLGAYLFGTLNLWLSGAPGIARSVEGALAGGIVGIELYNWCNGISLRTGARFALPLADTVVTIGRRLLGGGSRGRGPAGLATAFGRVLTGDRAHIHHRLLGLGLSQRAAVLLLYGLMLLGSAIALLTMDVQ